MDHPYIGLRGAGQTGTVQFGSCILDNHGIVVAVGPGRPKFRVEITTCAFILLDKPLSYGVFTAAVALEDFLPDDITEARRRLTEQK